MQAFVPAIFATAASHAQAPPPAGFPGKAPAGPPAEIARFEAAPAVIKPGESATLHWEARNAYSLTIEPALGAVATRGNRTLAPAATTTYTLTVTGSGGTKTATATVTVAGTQPVDTAAAASADRPVPRMPDGKPDLSGVYLGGRDIRLAAPAVPKAGADGFRVVVREEDLGQGAQCLPSGVPGATLAPYPLQIVAKPDLVVILYEAFNIFRIVPIGRDHSEDLDATWLGNSVAHWDGDTLVVDVVGFNDKTLVAGFRHTEQLHVVERYRRTTYDTIAYEATVEDPNVFAAPVKYAGNLALHPEWEIGEYVCAENAKDYAELLPAQK
ncbi:MAG TPA: hypothetical protein VFX89_07925 [Gammaproteobacteria bacterium]|nr:hypothetical protein [Gammaproteobacteria bacterium]